MTNPNSISWQENGAEHSAPWRSENGSPPPRRVVIADDTTTADAAYRLACEGTALLWRGDFQNARQLLQAMARRLDKKPARNKKPARRSVTDSFHLYRQAQIQRAHLLGMLLIPVGAGHVIPLRRAPDVTQACEEAYGASDGAYVVSLRELQGVIGAHEWRKKGVDIPSLGQRIHPHYGVFSPIRGEYLDLIEKQPLPPGERAFDIGTGTGVIAALLIKKGAQKVIATETNPRALLCARDNIERLGLAHQVDVVEADLFPEGRASLIVCNPPWLPARAGSLLDQAIYDPDSRMLLGFLDGLAAHLKPGGEGWLILSDLAEHLGLRSRDFLSAAIARAGLAVLGCESTRPHHPKASDQDDPLHDARSQERTMLWRLGAL